MAGLSAGMAGEVIAARFLRDKGYEIVTVNYRCRLGEIDIIAKDRRYIVFVEVKTRGERAFYEPREAVTLEKQRKIIQTASLYLQHYPSPLQPRFDVVEVLTGQGAPLQPREIDHIIGAFETGDLHAAF